MNEHRSVGRLLIGLTALILLAGCGAGATPSPSTQPSPSPSPAVNADEALMKDLDALWSGPYDAAKVAALYATDATFHDRIANETSKGLEAIQAKVKKYAALDFKVTSTSAPIRQGDYVAAFHRFGTVTASEPGLSVIELKDGKVLNTWVYPAGSSSAASSPAASADEALVADLAAVFSKPYDAAKVAALYAPDAVIHETTANMTQRGVDEIGARIRYFNEQDFEAVMTSPAIRQGDFMAAFHRYGAGGALTGRALVVYELKDGKVLTQWIYPAD